MPVPIIGYVLGDTMEDMPVSTCPAISLVWPSLGIDSLETFKAAVVRKGKEMRGRPGQEEMLESLRDLYRWISKEERGGLHPDLGIFNGAKPILSFCDEAGIKWSRLGEGLVEVWFGKEACYEMFDKQTSVVADKDSYLIDAVDGIVRLRWVRLEYRG